MGIGFGEIAIVLLILVVIFGARKLPELGRGLGSGMREFKDGITGKDEPAEIEHAEGGPAAHPAAPAPPTVADAQAQQPLPPRTEE